MSRPETQNGEIAIDPEFQALIPSLSDDEVSQLRANIKHDGCHDPLVTWKGVLLDGHHRYELCEDLGKPFKTVERPCANRDEAKAWIIRNQFGRRNLTLYQRCELALKLEPLIAAKAKKKQRDSGGAVPQKSAKPPLDTRAELAREAGVSHDTMAKAKAIHEKAPEAVKAQLRTGDLSIIGRMKACAAVVPTSHTTQATPNGLALRRLLIQPARSWAGSIWIRRRRRRPIRSFVPRATSPPNRMGSPRGGPGVSG